MTDPRIAKMNPGSKGHPRSCMLWLFLLCLLIGCAAFGQGPAAAPCKTDTVTLPIYHYQHSDTIAAAIMLKSGKVIGGYAILTGFKVQTNKGMQWSAEPVASWFLDRRKRVIDGKRIIKAF